MRVSKSCFSTRIRGVFVEKGVCENNSNAQVVNEFSLIISDIRGSLREVIAFSD